MGDEADYLESQSDQGAAEDMRQEVKCLIWFADADAAQILKHGKLTLSEGSNREYYGS